MLEQREQQQHFTIIQDGGTREIKNNNNNSKRLENGKLIFFSDTNTFFHFAEKFDRKHFISSGLMLFFSKSGNFL